MIYIHNWRGSDSLADSSSGMILCWFNILKLPFTTNQGYLLIHLTQCLLHTWVRASWIEFNNYPTRCDLFSLLHFCRQLYMFWVLTPIIRSSYSCKYSFWYWLTGSTIIRSCCWVPTQREQMIVDDGCQHPKHVELPTEM